MPGILLISPGKTIDPAVIATFIAELSRRYRIRGLAYDRWRMDDLLREFDRIGLQSTIRGTARQGVPTACGWCHGAKASRIWARRSMRLSWRSSSAS